VWTIALPKTILHGFYKVHQGSVLVRLMMSNWKIIPGNNWLWTTIWTWEIYDMLGFWRLCEEQLVEHNLENRKWNLQVNYRKH
jgi:hypothetical protein